MYVNTLVAATPEEIISLQENDLEHIQFAKIKTNRITYHNKFLQIDVEDSASFLLIPFVTVKKIKKVSFEWQSEGSPKVKNSQHEQERKGDDAVFKLGLLLLSDEQPFHPFASSWMKRVDKLLNYPSEKMIYLVADAKHKAGEQWISPYNKRVTMIAVKSIVNKQGWYQASYQFEQPMDTVALWLMADGDNTHSRFTSRIKNIKIE